MRPNQNFINMLHIGNAFDTSEVTYFHDSPDYGLGTGFTYSDRSQTLITTSGQVSGSPYPSISINSGTIRLGSQWDMQGGDGIYSVIMGGMVSASLPSVNSSNYMEGRMSWNENYSLGSSGTFVYVRRRRIAGSWSTITGYMVNGVSYNSNTISDSVSKVKVVFVSSTNMAYIYYAGEFASYDSTQVYTLLSSYDMSASSDIGEDPFYINHIANTGTTYTMTGTVLSNKSYGLNRGTYAGYQSYPPGYQLFGTASRY